MTSPEDAASAQRHPIVTGVAWFLATISVILTAFVIWMVITVISEWSNYEGSESEIALTLVGFAALMALAAWGLTWIVFAARRR